MHFEFAYFYLVLINLEFKRYLHSYTPVVPSKTIPDSRPKWAFQTKKAQNPSLWGRRTPPGERIPIDIYIYICG